MSHSAPIGTLRGCPVPGALLHRPAGGFTLVEVLIATSVAVVLGLALISLVVKQGRFYDRTRDGVYAQQSLRSAADLLATELRMAGATDIIAAARDSVVLRFDVSRAIVCDSLAPDEVALFVYDSVHATNLPAAFRGTAISEPFTPGVRYADAWTGSITASGSGPKSRCTEHGAPGDQPDRDYRAVAGWLNEFGVLPSRGSVVRTYGRLAYRLADSRFAAGVALQRNGQDLATSLAEGAGFTYVLDDGRQTATPAATDLSRVRSIRFDATSIGETSRSAARSVEHEVHLRN